MLKRTTAINKILALKKRIKIIQGGTSAGKTFGILPILINKACLVSGLDSLNPTNYKMYKHNRFSCRDLNSVESKYLEEEDIMFLNKK